MYHNDIQGKTIKHLEDAHTTMADPVLNLSENEKKRVIFLKNTLHVENDEKVIKESINVAHRIVKIVADGGSVRFTESNGKTGTVSLNV